ncbi:efflux RND transporter periplasmic adaptor subunit [Roseivirga sp. BDSF3-8]|uniref:efflux RND transporter periplasmic adaptor subunit n=1 Tax=Roseivirga sp. BDSF3-8 TaxID=3241598 RepID=UPI0035327D61
MSKAVKSTLTVLIILVVLFLIAWPKLDFLHGEDKAQEPSGNSSMKAEQIPVNVVVVEEQTANQNIRITGTIQANESVELRSEVSGKVTRIYFDEGQPVNRGQMLVTINDEELRAQMEKLKYTQQLYNETEQRQKKLLEREAISQEEYDIALTELKTATADIKLLQAQIAKSQLRAPFSGIIGLRFISDGSYITPSDPIATLYNLNPAKIEFSIPGKYAEKVQEGDSIRFNVESMEGTFKGQVYAIEPRIDPSTRTVLVRAKSDNTDKRLLPGQFARIELTLGRTENALMVPSQAVIPELDGHKVFVVKEGKAQAKKVTLGTRTELAVEVTEGLAPKDSVITTGILQIREGSEVDPFIEAAD